MKTLAIIAYSIGSILLIVSCFTEDITLTWWIGGSSVLFLILGCVFQFHSNKHFTSVHHDHKF